MPEAGPGHLAMAARHLSQACAEPGGLGGPAAGRQPHQHGQQRWPRCSPQVRIHGRANHLL